ncbi:Hydroxyacylglutathione hydrolase [Candidatus Lokiarchaeum ossiferum]|uniref:Hydroxyacylglutathione hydrolase n=1 Tax=Candidatus Lokiarchaeum ossiferum TaxID=2951803 RepID=A0ABY6HQK5_9ARCH|nr:Hydroxyacylglutathione hydrolase [Candidatus Lokiarchaeum sp. B-35]
MSRESKKNRINHFGKIIKDPDFIIFRPNNHYRINSNVILIKTDDEMALLESGKKDNPSIHKLIHTLNKERIPLKTVKYLLISHAHQDHYANIRQVQQNFHHINTYCHEKDARVIRLPFLLPKTWKEGLHYNNCKKSTINLYAFYYSVFSNVYFQSIQFPNRIDGTFKHDIRLRLGNEKINILHTPGHTEGHISVLDSRKNLYLADFVPNTPWIDPNPFSLNAMIHSIKKIISFDSTQIHRAIRGHGDIRREQPNEWEISNWWDEKARFRKFLETINSTLDLIPTKLQGKNMNVYQITNLFNEKFHRYSAIMRRFFIPPAVTWGIAYTLKLHQEGKVSLVKQKSKFLWTA